MAKRKTPKERARAPPLEMRCPSCQRKLALQSVNIEQCYSGACRHCRIEIEAVATELAGGQVVFETYPLPGGPMTRRKRKEFAAEEYPEDDYYRYFPFAGPDSEGVKPKKKGN